MLSSSDQELMLEDPAGIRKYSALEEHEDAENLGLHLTKGR